jgi:hypothetical protein
LLPTELRSGAAVRAELGFSKKNREKEIAKQKGRHKAGLSKFGMFSSG